MQPLQQQQQQQQQQAPDQLSDLISEAGSRAFDLLLAEKERLVARAEFDKLVDGAATWPLIRALNTLIRPGVVPKSLQNELMRILTRIPLRKDGVRATLEFVFSVHPSGAQRPANGARLQKQGANITPEALSMATKLLCAPPPSLTPTAWFEGIRSQLFALLDGQEGLELVQVASNIICSGLLSRRQFGAPGAPGWTVLIEPILKCVNPSLVKEVGDVDPAELADGVVHIHDGRTLLCTFVDLSRALKRLTSLLLSSPFPAQCRRVIRPILLPIWTLSSLWTSLGQQAQEAVCAPARALLQTYMKLVTPPGEAWYILHNLLRNGSARDDVPGWEFQLTSNNNEVQVVRLQKGALSLHDGLRLDRLSETSRYFPELLLGSWTSGEFSDFFLALLGRCLLADEPGTFAIQAISTSSEPAPEPTIQKLIEMAVLQRMLETASGKLIGRFHQLLGLICRIFEADSTRAQPEEEVVTVTLSLLNLVITAPTFSRSQLPADTLALLERSLDRLDRQHQGSISLTARNLALLLRYRDDMDDSVPPDSRLNDRQAEDRKKYSLAMSYILDAESPPPVKTEGLNLLSGLVQVGSPVLDIAAVLVLLSTLVKNEEDYLNSFVVKLYTQIASRHPKSVCDELVELYVDVKETLSTDSRLRFGEALLQVIERLGETFTGEVAKKVGEALLSVASRRGYRPKTEARQSREERIRVTKDKEAKEAWGGEVLDLSDDMSVEQRATNNILAQIVEGWESKRGAEDVRMRSSALSIFAAAIDSNLAGIGHTGVSSAVDSSVSILTLEPELEKGILRRAAAVLVFSFISGLDKARRDGRRLGFSLVDSSRESIIRTMTYISTTDNDGLVRQYARDVIEGIESWHIASFLPNAAETDDDLVMKRIRGIAIGPIRDNQSGGVRRPKIEELD